MYSANNPFTYLSFFFPSPNYSHIKTDQYCLLECVVISLISLEKKQSNRPHVYNTLATLSIQDLMGKRRNDP